MENILFKNISKKVIVVAFASFILIIPIILLFIGGKSSSGIDLHNSILEKGFTIKNFKMLLVGNTTIAKIFRASILNSFIYSIITGLFSTFFAVVSNIWICSFSTKKAVSITFLLLSLILLPQTYLILAGLKLSSQIFLFHNEVFRIIFFLFISIVPIAIWFFYFIAGTQIRKIQILIALDDVKETKTIWIILKQTKIYIILLFIFSFALAWGNYLIPFALGSTKTFNAVVQVSTFTTNLGRDWAIIGAASFILCCIIILITTLTLIFYEKYRG